MASLRPITTGTRSSTIALLPTLITTGEAKRFCRAPWNRLKANCRWKPTYFFRLRMPCASSGARCQEAVGMQRCEWLTCHDGKLEMTFPAHLYCVESRFLPSWLVGSVERMEPTTRLELVTCRLRLQTLDVF